MRSTWLVPFFVCGLAGCHCLPAPQACQTETCATPGAVQVEEDAEEPTVIVKKRRKVVAPPCDTPCATGGMSQGMPQGMAYPQGMAFGGAPATATVSDHIGLGLTFDSFNISIPFPKLIAVQKPAELNIRMPVQQAGFGMGMGVGMPMGFPVAQGFPMAQGFPVAQGVPVGMGMPMGVPMAQGVPAGFGMQQFGAQGQFTPQQLALLAQMANAQGAGANAQGADAQGADKTSDAALEAMLKRCDDLRKLKDERDRLRKQNGQ